jgi:hypothetical protein
MGAPLGDWTPLQLGIGAAATVPVGMAADASFRWRAAKRRRVAAAKRQAEASGKLVELEAMREAATAVRANLVIAVGTAIMVAIALAPF